jgi:DNA-binding GntR family transcriptional regulator
VRRPETLTTAVARTLADEISRGQLRAGSNLPEVALAERLGVSRGTVREALRLLTDGGLVEVIPHRGVFVAEISPKRVREVIGLRMLLEPYAARLAVEGGQLQGSGMVAIRESLQWMHYLASAPDDAAAFVDADLRLHETISSYCDNDTLLSVLTMIRSQVRRFMFWGHIYDHSDVQVEYQHHQHLVEVLESGDPEAVELATRQHVERAGRTFLARLTEAEAEPSVLPVESYPPARRRRS